MPDAITRLNAALEGRYRIERELGEGGSLTKKGVTGHNGTEGKGSAAHQGLPAGKGARVPEEAEGESSARKRRQLAPETDR